MAGQGMLYRDQKTMECIGKCLLSKETKQCCANGMNFGTKGSFDAIHSLFQIVSSVKFLVTVPGVFFFFLN